MALTGKTLAVGPALAARKEIRDGSLKAIPIHDADFADATSAVCVHRDRRLSYAANEFLKKINKAFTAAAQGRFP
jgi:DNA-binding transcriptional LysR family regulator